MTFDITEAKTVMKQQSDLCFKNREEFNRTVSFPVNQFEKASGLVLKYIDLTKERIDWIKIDLAEIRAI